MLSKKKDVENDCFRIFGGEFQKTFGEKKRIVANADSEFLVNGQIGLKQETSGGRLLRKRKIGFSVGIRVISIANGACG